MTGGQINLLSTVHVFYLVLRKFHVKRGLLDTDVGNTVPLSCKSNVSSYFCGCVVVITRHMKKMYFKQDII